MSNNDNKPKIKFIPIDEAHDMAWRDNAKLHDIGAIAQSIHKYGLIELPRYDETLQAIVAGNGRIHALWMMWRDKEDTPRGVAVDDDGMWLIPIVFGINAETVDMARSYAIDSNNLVLAGSGMSAIQAAKMWDSGVYELQLVKLALNGVNPVSVDGDSLDALLRLRERQDKEDKQQVSGDVHGDKYRLGNVEIEVVTIEQFLDIISAGGKSIDGRRIVVVGMGPVRQWEQANNRVAKKVN